MNTDKKAAEKYPHQGLTRVIIGAAFAVHNELGWGFLEKVYENALRLELEAIGLAVEQQAEIPVMYREESVGVYYADLLVNQLVICELKSAKGLTNADEAQLLHYLKATGIKVGLLLNFGPERVDTKRMVF